MQSLRDLLAGDFLGKAFDASPLVLRAGTQAWAEILTLDDVEYLVRTAPPSGDWLQLAKCGGFLPLSGSLVSAGVSVRTSAIRKRVAQGFSLVLNHVRQRLKSVDSVCATIASAVKRRANFALKYPLSANLYATPPESEAFVPHYDGRGALVFQLSGCKRCGFFRE